MEINIDFDGTCVAHDFPKIGAEIGAVRVLKRLVENGHRLILFTMRSNRITFSELDEEIIPGTEGNYLNDAIKWFIKHDIPLYGVNTNPTQNQWTESPKSYAHLMIDDSALGCPLIMDDRISTKPFVDWKKVEILLEEQKILPKLEN